MGPVELESVGGLMDIEEMDKIEEIFQRSIEVISEKFEQTVKHHMGIMSEDVWYAAGGLAGLRRAQ